MEMLKKRIWMCLAGVLLCGISVGFFKRAAFGVDPFQSFATGMNAVIPISYGTLYMILCAVFLAFVFVADRHYIGLATIINLTVVGYVADYSHQFLLWLFPDLSLFFRMLFLAVGIVVMCISSSLYFTADLGVSTYDAVSLIAANVWKIASFRVCRTVSDLICVALGLTLFLLGGGEFTAVFSFIGAGTVITAFLMGPLIEFFNRRLARPLLHGRSKKPSWDIDPEQLSPVARLRRRAARRCRKAYVPVVHFLKRGFLR